MRAGRLSLFVLLALPQTACAPDLIQTYSLPNASIGTGRVVSATPLTVASAEDSATRAGRGFVQGGVMGVLVSAASEGDLGTSSMRQYEVAFSDGSMLTFRSFSPAAAGDCVTITPMPNKTDMIAERVASDLCGQK